MSSEFEISATYQIPQNVTRNKIIYNLKIELLFILYSKGLMLFGQLAGDCNGENSFWVHIESLNVSKAVNTHLC